MSIYKTPKSPYFQYDFQFKGKRFHGSTGCKTERDAKRFEANERQKAALGGGDLGEELTVNRAFGLWWETVGLHKRNWKTDEYRLQALVDGLSATRILSVLTLRDFDAYIAKRKAPRTVPAKTHMAKGKLVVDRPEKVVRLSASSINREVQLARRVFLWLSAPGRGYKVPRISWKDILQAEPKERVRELSASEEARLFAVLPADLLAMVEFAMLSGQRRTELVTLKWTDVDFDAETATVTPKGQVEDRHTFPLTERMVEILDGLPRVSGIKEVFTYEAEDDAPPSKDGKVVRLKGKRYAFSKQGWTRKWRRALAEAGIENFHFHDLRHTAATRLVRSTGNLKLAQRLLNHSDIQTTARYAHATDDDLRAGMTSSHSRKVQDSRNNTGRVAKLRP